MNGSELVAGLPEAVPSEIDREALAALLEAAEVIRQDNTGIAGWIRILSVDGSVIVQERNQEGTVFIRRLASCEEAHVFVNDRLDTYERMWDG